MNIATRTHRKGHGSRLYQHIEAIMKKNGFSVIVLYPADNTQAPLFWGKHGFKMRETNPILPDHEKHQVIKEMDCATGEILPMWEKDLTKRTLPRRVNARGQEQKIT